MSPSSEAIARDPQIARHYDQQITATREAVAGETGQELLDHVLTRLGPVRMRRPNQWSARCPAHDDRTPSLDISFDPGPKTIAVRCWAGCPTSEVLQAVGLEFHDLWAARRKKSPQRSHIETFWAKVQAFAWPGSAGLADYLVLYAHCAVAWRINRYSDYGLAVREVAELTGLGVGTVLNAQRRLVQKHKLLRALARDAQADACRWSLPAPEELGWHTTDADSPLTGSESAGCVTEQSQLATETPPLSPMSVQLRNSDERVFDINHPACDAWARRALGPAAWRLWILLEHRARTPKQLASATGLHKATVSRALGAMVAHGLVSRQADGSYRRAGAALDEVARALGTDGRREQMRRRHLLNRGAFAQRREQRLDEPTGWMTEGSVDPDTGEIFSFTDERALVAQRRRQLKEARLREAKERACALPADLLTPQHGHGLIRRAIREINTLRSGAVESPAPLPVETPAPSPTDEPAFELIERK